MRSSVGLSPRASVFFQEKRPQSFSEMRRGCLLTSISQLANTFFPFGVLWIAMYWALPISYVLVLGLALPTAGLLVRIFIIQHDCGHMSFFKSRRANVTLGRICSLFTFTPFAHWRLQHAGHHRNWNNLDHRQSGVDIYSSCLTVEEYCALSASARLQYRIVRMPIISLVLMPPLIFTLLYRVPFDTPRTWVSARRSVWLTNIALACLFGVAGYLFGFVEMVLIQAPVTIMASIIGVWLFSLQHRFPHVQWARAGKWTREVAALRGSSYLQLPRLLQWFTGNIGFHHIHHLDPLVPNYRLERCHRESEWARTVRPLTLREGLLAHRFVLWDEDRCRMTGFKAAAHVRKRIN
jgi:acyl-lipid omega-6 desaturase (Delta-12 desaturase)